MNESAVIRYDKTLGLVFFSHEYCSMAFPGSTFLSSLHHLGIFDPARMDQRKFTNDDSAPCLVWTHSMQHLLRLYV